MKTKEELNALKEEVEILNKKLAELTDEELAQVSGGGVVEITSAKMLEKLTAADVGSTILYNGVMYNLTDSKVENHVVFRNASGGCIYVAKY